MKATEEQIKALSDSVSHLENTTMVLAFELQEERDPQALGLMVLSIMQASSDLLDTMATIRRENREGSDK